MSETRRQQLEKLRARIRSSGAVFEAGKRGEKAGRILGKVCARLAPPPPFPVPSGADLEVINAAIERARGNLEEIENAGLWSRRAIRPGDIERKTAKIVKQRERIAKLARMAAGLEALDHKYIYPFR